MQIYFILLLFYIDTNSIFYYIHLNFLHYPKFCSFCIILPIFSCLSKKPTGLGFFKKPGFSERWCGSLESSKGLELRFAVGYCRFTSVGGYSVSSSLFCCVCLWTFLTVQPVHLFYVVVFFGRWINCWFHDLRWWWCGHFCRNLLRHISILRKPYIVIFINKYTEKQLRFLGRVTERQERRV